MPCNKRRPPLVEGASVAARPRQRGTRPQQFTRRRRRNRRRTKMAPLTWRVALNDLRKGFKVKSSSPVFTKGKHEFCLDVYRDGWGDEDREFVAVFRRYVSGEARARASRPYN